MIISEEVLEELKESAGLKRKEKANKIVKENKVKITKVTYEDKDNFSIHAQVKGNNKYFTYIEVKNNEIENLSCTCLDYESTYGTCKHILATALEFEKNLAYIKLFGDKNVVVEEENIKKNNDKYRIYRQMISSFYTDEQKEEKNSKIESIAIHRYEKVGELYNDFKLGNIDFIHTDSDILEDYIGTLGYHKKEYKGRALDFLAINCQNQALSKKEVRQAIQYGIDKTGIINTIFQNKYESSNFPLDFGQYLYTEEKESVYDTAKVKQVLEENGWTLQSKVWQKRENRTTLRLSFTLTVLETNEKRVQVAEAIRDSLEPLGIKLTVRKVSEKEYQNILEKKNYELLLTGIYSSFSPDLTYFLGEGNLAGYRNETALQLLQEINDITEQNLLQQKIQELANIYLEDVPYICLYRNKETTAYSQKLAGNVAGNCYNIFYHIEDWYRQ